MGRSQIEGCWRQIRGVMSLLMKRNTFGCHRSPDDTSCRDTSLSRQAWGSRGIPTLLVDQGLFRESANIDSCFSLML